MLNNNKSAMHRVFFLTLLITMIQVHVSFAQKNLRGEKLIERFMNELSKPRSMPDSVLQRYIISDGTEQSINNIHEGLILAKTAYLINKAEKSTGYKIEELIIGPPDADTRYYSIRHGNRQSLNFVIWKDKIKSISSYTESNYNTTIFF